ncbi:MAG: hypothetical protein EOO07_10385 [Chitinophagaceae bacterium]|nr:MAG: hypothetical protein EOO07_10385 [Chitinophagaceae bacterium]
MVTLVLRTAILLGGAAYLFNAFLPTVTGLVKVERHSIIVEPPAESYIKIHTVSFKGAVEGSCSVDEAVYSKISDGDVLAVETTRLFKQCIKIEKNSQLLYHSRFWKFFNIILGVTLISLGSGLLRKEKVIGIVGRANE